MEERQTACEKKRSRCSARGKLDHWAGDLNRFPWVQEEGKVEGQRQQG